MCTTCGCGNHSALVGGKAMPRHKPKGAFAYRPHAEAPAHEVAHAHDPAQARIIQVERDILSKNDALAASNRGLFAARNILALNLVSSPGSGKTTLLVRTLQMLKEKFPHQPVRPELVEGPGCATHVVRQAHPPRVQEPLRGHERSLFMAVIEGDQQTDNDAERIRATGVQAVQINTGKGCHLDADMVGHALEQLALPNGALLFIENVGNLVCPAAFDLGEAAKVVVLSVTEGEDKPLKYPDMFRAAKLMLLNKCDLLPYLSFDVQRAMEYARRVNPGIEIIQLSATTGTGMEEWLAWIAREREGAASLPIADVLERL